MCINGSDIRAFFCDEKEYDEGQDSCKMETRWRI